MCEECIHEEVLEEGHPESGIDALVESRRQDQYDEIEYWIEMGTMD